MAIVNKFNVNNKQVTLDADIIENMSANDVSYDSSTQYDENTVGNKLSELDKQINGHEEIKDWTEKTIDDGVNCGYYDYGQEVFAGWQNYGVAYPIGSNMAVNIIANESVISEYGVYGNDPSKGGSIVRVDGFAQPKHITNGESVTIDIPEGGKFLLIKKADGSFPSSVKIGTYNHIDGLADLPIQEMCDVIFPNQNIEDITHADNALYAQNDVWYDNWISSNISTLVKVEPNKEYKISIKEDNYITFLNSNVVSVANICTEEPKTKFTAGEHIRISPNDAKFLCMFTTAYDRVVVQGNIAQTVESICLRTTNNEERIAKLEQGAVLSYLNILDKNNVVGGRVNPSGGISGNDNMFASDFIELKANTLYYFGYVYMYDGWFAFYSDTNEGSFLPSHGCTVTLIPRAFRTFYDKINNTDVGNFGTILTSNNDVYIRVSCLKNKIEYSYISEYVDAYRDHSPVSANKLNGLIAKTSLLKDKRVLIIGDSISSYNFNSFDKWVDVLKKEGFLPHLTNNESKIGTGFLSIMDGGDRFIDRITDANKVPEPDKYDLVIIFGGINDFGSSFQIGDYGDDRDVYFKASVDYFFNYLADNFTQARVLIVKPLLQDKISTNNIGLNQFAYSDCIEEVAHKYSFPILDGAMNSGYNPKNAANLTKWSFPDKLHPNKECEEKLIAPMIWRFIESFFLVE